MSNRPESEIATANVRIACAEVARLQALQASGTTLAPGSMYNAERSLDAARAHAAGGWSNRNI